MTDDIKSLQGAVLVAITQFQMFVVLPPYNITSVQEMSKRALEEINNLVNK